MRIAVPLPQSAEHAPHSLVLQKHPEHLRTHQLSQSHGEDSHFLSSVLCQPEHLHSGALQLHQEAYMSRRGDILQGKGRPHFWVLQGSVSCDSRVAFWALHWVISTGRPTALSMHVMERCRVPPPHGAEHSPLGPSCKLYLSGPSTCTSTQVCPEAEQHAWKAGW